MLVANSVDPDEMRHFVLVFKVCQTRHIYAQTVQMVHQLYFSKKKLSAHMITGPISYPPKSVLLSIYFHNVCKKNCGFSSTGPGGFINCVFIL